MAANPAFAILVSMAVAADITYPPACADRSGGPAMKPKPGDSYETGADRAGGRPWGPDEADGWPWRRTADPGGSVDMLWSPGE